MFDIDFALVFDAVMAILLVVTIVYAALLNRKLSALREAREEMQGLVEAFADATTRAEHGLAELKTTAEASGDALQERIDSAKNLVADINFVVKRGDEVANRMEEAIRASRRSAADPMPQQSPAAQTADPKMPDPRVAVHKMAGAEAQSSDEAAKGQAAERPSAFRAARALESDAPSRPGAKRPLSAEQSQLLKALEGMR